jgi:UDP-glucose 4-epimerase
LIDLITTCVDHPNAANQTFLISDGEDMSSPELILRIAQAMNKSILLVPLPVWLLQMGGKLVGREKLIQRLCGNLQVDISKTMELLGWRPPIGIDEELRRTVAFHNNG